MAQNRTAQDKLKQNDKKWIRQIARQRGIGEYTHVIIIYWCGSFFTVIQCTESEIFYPFW